MKIQATIIFDLKEEGLMAFFKNNIIKQVIKSSQETTINNDMVNISVSDVKVLSS